MDVHVSRCGRVLKSLLDVGQFEVGVLREDLIERLPSGDQTDHGLHGDAQPADGGFALELVGLEGDAVERHRFLLLAAPQLSGGGSFRCITVLRWRQQPPAFRSLPTRSARRIRSGSYRRSRRGGWMWPGGKKYTEVHKRLPLPASLYLCLPLAARPADCTKSTS